MNLHSDYPFWMLKEGIKNAFPALDADLKTDVLIVGGGITGALIAHKLSKAGLETALVEKRHVGFGSTSASTALLQYEIDTPLFKLKDLIGEKNAVRAYQICEATIPKLEKMCRSVPGGAGFERHPSLLFASYKKHTTEIIEPEYRARKQAGFKVKLLSEEVISRKYGFNAPSAISSEMGAQLNPYALTQHLLKKAGKMGCQIFDLTEVKEWKPSSENVILKTTCGHTITAKHVVVACGYESQNYLPKNVTKLNSSFAIVSKPLTTKDNLWFKNSLIWETKRPYLYIRTTPDNRIIVGGRDEKFYNPEKRDQLLPKKHQELEADFQKMFPNIPFQTDFAWAGTFGETKDGLPYIGSYNSPRTLFAMGYGGNGITFSVAAASILRDIILGKKNKDAALFSFDR
jgi:glycine/D-amino acid oxidase-like deaminating enzyme